jgi:hypothetical protein
MMMQNKIVFGNIFDGPVYAVIFWFQSLQQDSL